LPDSPTPAEPHHAELHHIEEEGHDGLLAQWNFVIQWTVVVLGFAVHAALDRS
jgi:hypothetical protein